MPTVMASNLLRRQIIGTDDDGNVDWWYSNEAFIIKWVVVAAIFAFFLIFVVGGYFHARHRMKKGLRPLRYQRYLISRQQREQYFPTTLISGVAYHRPHRFSQTPQYGQTYPMQPWGPAPPAYQEPDYVPPYAPPQGSSKVNPDQAYTAPPGPPPAAAFTAPDMRRGAGVSSREVPASGLDDGWESSRVYPSAGPSRNAAK